MSCIPEAPAAIESKQSFLQHNNFKRNQQRVATVKYLGELYTYRVVESRVVLDTLWTLTTFGHRELHSLMNDHWLRHSSQPMDDLNLVKYLGRSTLKTTTSEFALSAPC